MYASVFSDYVQRTRFFRGCLRCVSEEKRRNLCLQAFVTDRHTPACYCYAALQQPARENKKSKEEVKRERNNYFTKGVK